MDGRDRSKFEGYEHTPQGKKEIRIRNGAIGLCFLGGAWIVWFVYYSNYAQRLRQQYSEHEASREERAEKYRSYRVDLGGEFTRDKDNLLPVNLNIFKNATDYFAGKITLYEFFSCRRFKDDESRQRYVANNPHELLLKKK